MARCLTSRDDIALDKNKKHDIDVYVDRLIIKGDRGDARHARQRLRRARAQTRRRAS